MIQLSPQKQICGTFNLPGDKSISHRAALFALFSRGTSAIENLNTGKDVATTLSFLRGEGISLNKAPGPVLEITGCGLPFINKSESFDCGNSGTTLSLLMGILKKKCRLTGDDSLKSRNFLHQISVLRECGYQFKFEGREGHVPFEMCPSTVISTMPHFKNTINSAQLKTTLLLAALNSHQSMRFKESISTRDHTERLLKGMGAKIEKSDDEITMEAYSELKPLKLFVPGDISLASFFITAVLLSEGSHVILRHVSLNPTRLAFIKLLKDMKARINIKNENHALEPYGDIEVSSSYIEGGEVPVEMIGELIDEIPCLALLGLVARHGMHIKGAERLRNKETDRISAICYNLRNSGAHIEEYEDGFKVYPGIKLREGVVIKSFKDHRMVMAFSLLAFLLKHRFSIDEPEWVNTSYPGFFKDMFNL